MTRRQQNMRYFLQHEEMEEQIKTGLVALHSDGILVKGEGFAWAYLCTYWVQPSNAKRRLGSVQVANKIMRISTLPVPPEKRRDTIAHEVAHIICHWNHGTVGKAHGKEWKRIAKALGSRGERCYANHELGEEALAIVESKKKPVAVCLGCDEVFNGHRRRSYLDKKVYTHVGCGGRVVGWPRRR